MPRTWKNNTHLHSLVSHPTSPAHGRILIQPQDADRIVIECAMSNHLPANLPQGARDDTYVLDIGRGVQVRIHAAMHRKGDVWDCEPRPHATQYPSGRDLTPPQTERLRALLSNMVTYWALGHAGDIAQADDIARHNAASVLEEQIAKHEEALRILRANLTACDEGEPFETYPDLPTKRR